MAEKELRRMSRTELIEIIYALQQENDALREQADALQAKLDDKSIRLEQAGSIAEASLALNRVFEDAQAAADQYLASVRSQAQAGQLAEAQARQAAPAASYDYQRQQADAQRRQQAAAEAQRQQAAAQQPARHAEAQHRSRAAYEEQLRQQQANEAVRRRGDASSQSSGWRPGKYDDEAAARNAAGYHYGTSVGGEAMAS